MVIRLGSRTSNHCSKEHSLSINGAAVFLCVLMFCSTVSLIVRMISEKEYEQYQSYEVRRFSGHWMLFYIVAAAGLFSNVNRNRDK